MTNRATFTTKYASMQSEFGESYASKLFGDLINKLPKYSKGKNKGKFKGQLSWTKVDSGGFVKEAFNVNGGYVETRKNWVIQAEIKDVFTNEVYMSLKRNTFDNEVVINFAN